MIIYRTFLYVLWAFAVGVTVAYAADLPREQRLEAQLRSGVLSVELVELTAGNHQFIGLYSRSLLPDRKGGVILLHDAGANPDILDPMRTLRTGLPKGGWDTLSIQMPLAPADAGADEYATLIPEASPRIEAALAHVRAQGIENIALLGHGLGAEMAVAYLAENAQAGVKAATLLSMEMTAGSDGESAFAKLTLPVFDIDGSRDSVSVIRSRETRAAVARRSGNNVYRQWTMVGADHEFRNHGAVLASRISAWLTKVVTQP